MAKSIRMGDGFHGKFTCDLVFPFRVRGGRVRSLITVFFCSCIDGFGFACKGATGADSRRLAEVQGNGGSVAQTTSSARTGLGSGAGAEDTFHVS